MSSKKNFSESATKRYALALYELSKENSELDKIEDQSKNMLNLLKNMNNRLSSEQIQKEIYEIGKNHNFANLRDFFKLIYQVLLGQEQGPRLGSFIKLYGLSNTCQLLEKALKGENLSN